VPAYLAATAAELTVTQKYWPKIAFHRTREHTGLAQEAAA
jgi:hypothetical protein